MVFREKIEIVEIFCSRKALPLSSAIQQLSHKMNTSFAPSYAELLADWKISQAKKALRDAKKERRALSGGASDAESVVAKAVLAPYAEADDSFVSSLPEPPAKRRKLTPLTEVVVDDDSAVANLTKAFAAMAASESKTEDEADADSDGGAAPSAHAKPHLLRAGVTYRLVTEGVASIIKEIHDGVRKSPLHTVSWAVGTKHDPSSKTPAAVIALFETQGAMDLKTAADMWLAYGDAEVNPKKFKDFLRELVKQGIIVAVETV